MVVAGDREAEAGQASVRMRSGQTVDAMAVADVATMITDKIAAKQMP
jgi:threonyl-tRNA synthetase